MTDNNRIRTTRVVIVPAGGPSVEVFADEFLIDYQDQGRTLKLIAQGSGASARQERDTALARDFRHIATRG